MNRVENDGPIGVHNIEVSLYYVHNINNKCSTARIFVCTAATWRAMCASGQETVNRTLSQQAVSGQCNMSEDCLVIDCSMEISIGFFKIPVELTSSPLPCSRPYGIVVQSSGSALSSSISGTFTETTAITRRVGTFEVTVTYDIEQTDKGILVGVSSDGHYAHRSQHMP